MFLEGPLQEQRPLPSWSEPCPKLLGEPDTNVRLIDRNFGDPLSLEKWSVSVASTAQRLVGAACTVAHCPEFSLFRHHVKLHKV